MMQPILLRVQLFKGPGDQPRSQKALLWLLEGLCKVNEGHLLTGNYPSLYKAGVVYERENGTEEWLDVPNIIATGKGDCEDLACWRVAELRAAGQHARPYAKWRRVDGVYHYHAMVLRYSRNGRTWLEDPSRRLGMNAPEETSTARRQLSLQAVPREGRKGR